MPKNKSRMRVIQDPNITTILMIIHFSFNNIEPILIGVFVYCIKKALFRYRFLPLPYFTLIRIYIFVFHFLKLIKDFKFYKIHITHYTYIYNNNISEQL